jgi:aminopeptidase N
MRCTSATRSPSGYLAPVRSALACALILLLALPAAAAGQSVTVAGPAPTSHRLDLTYEPRGAGRLSGTQTIEFANRGPNPIDLVLLRLWANGPDGCRPQRMSVQVDAPASVDPLAVRCTVLPVRLGQPLAPGASSSLTLRWTLQGRRARFRFGRSKNVRLLGYVVPMLVVTDARGTLIPPYVPFAESFYSLSAAWDATLRLPSRLRAATTGSVVEDRVEGGQRILHVSTPHARDFALAIGRWRTFSGRSAGTTVRVHAQSRRAGRRMLRVARESVDRFSARFGPYDSPELDVVHIAEGYGMEFPELVFSNSDPYIVAHEVAHEWWYSIVGNDQYAEPWLDESFATWAGARVGGTLAYCRRLPFKSVPPNLRRARLDSGMGRFRNRELAYVRVVYDAGACVWRWLERRIGSRRMTAFLRLLVSRHRHGLMTKADLLAALAEAAPGLNMRRFRRVAHIG